MRAHSLLGTAAALAATTTTCSWGGIQVEEHFEHAGVQVAIMTGAYVPPDLLQGIETIPAHIREDTTLELRPYPYTPLGPEVLGVYWHHLKLIQLMPRPGIDHSIELTGLDHEYAHRSHYLAVGQAQAQQQPHGNDWCDHLWAIRYEHPDCAPGTME